MDSVNSVNPGIDTPPLQLLRKNLGEAIPKLYNRLLNKQPGQHNKLVRDYLQFFELYCIMHELQKYSPPPQLMMCEKVPVEDA